MKRSKSQLNAISYSYRAEKQRYYDFLVDFCYHYCPTNSDRYFKIHRYKYLGVRIKHLLMYACDFCPNFFFYLYFGKNLFDFYDILNEEYKLWKKRGGSFEE